MFDLRLPRRWLRTAWSSGMQCHIIRREPEVTEEHIASEKFKFLRTTGIYPSSLHLQALSSCGGTPAISLFQNSNGIA